MELNNDSNDNISQAFDTQNEQEHSLSINGADKKSVRGTLVREQLRYCNTIIKSLKRHKDSPPFLHPVDPVLLNIPDYFNVVKNPMDMETITNKLNNCEYETAENFIEDVRLMLNNCYTYNGPDSPVSKMAKNIEKSFNSYLSRMPTEASLASPYTEDEKRGSKSGIGRKRRNSSSGFSPKIPHSKRKSSSRKSNVADQMKFCLSVWKEMTKKTCMAFAWPFMQPVDPVALGIPDYFDVIKEPRDLSYIKSQLDNSRYNNCDEFKHDVELMFQNCYSYNPPDSDVVSMAKKLHEVFNSKWKRKPNFDAEGVHHDFDESDSEADWSSDEESREIKSLQSQIKELNNQIALLRNKRKKRRGSKKQKTTEDLRPMTYEEKLELSKNISDLPTEKIGKVIEIIHANFPDLKNNNEDEEIELEIDRLDIKTLRLLEKYVNDTKAAAQSLKKQKVDDTKSSQLDKYDSAESSSDDSDFKFEEAANTVKEEEFYRKSPAPVVTKASTKKSNAKPATISTSAPPPAQSSGLISFSIDESLAQLSSSTVNEATTPKPAQNDSQANENSGSVEILNADSWGDLVTEKVREGSPISKADSVWSEFQTTALQQKQREKERIELEEKLRIERELKEEETKRERENQLRDKKAKEAAEKRKEELSIQSKREEAKKRLLDSANKLQSQDQKSVMDSMEQELLNDPLGSFSEIAAQQRKNSKDEFDFLME